MGLINKLKNFKKNYHLLNVKANTLEAEMNNVKSELDVQRKINEEHNMQSYNRVVDEDKNQLDNLDNLETQEYLIFINVFEKGKTSILQYSTNCSKILVIE